MSFKLAQRDECETAGNWQLARRTLGLLKTIPPAAASFSCRCESLNPAYFPQANSTTFRRTSAPIALTGDRPRLP